MAKHYFYVTAYMIATMPGNILIIDDEEKLRALLKRIISLEGYQVYEASDLKKGHSVLSREQVDIVLCDVRLPDGNGVDFVKETAYKYPLVEIILLTAYGNIPDGVQAMKNGAFDYITKGDDNDKIIPLLNRAMEKVNLRKQVMQLEQKLEARYSFNNIIGVSHTLHAAVALAGKVAATDATVLLMGETGTGKEVFAQAIHTASRRANKTFVALNCSAFSKELLESELFGYKTGAFTGALKDKKGLMEEAHQGTLFLDEIGEMPFDLQSKLLRVIETSEFIKVGDTKQTSVNVRIIAATNRNLEKEVAAQKLREDLFYRLNGFTIELPPLRERKEDIPLLTDFYLSVFAYKTNKRIKGVTEEARQLLAQHNWKGNVRELKNVMERAVIIENSERITAGSLPFDIQHTIASEAGSFELTVVEKQHIQKVLLHTRNNKTEAARLLGIGLTTLYRKIEEYNIK